MKTYNCKVGTIPSQIQMKHGYKLEVGKAIIFRFIDEHNWRKGLIWKMNEDGYFFVKRM